jgi:aminoglycoside phosphotransferase (APT) family kinase protein
VVTPRGVGRPAADEIPALLEPIVRERIPGADQARIVDWRGTDRGYSTETFLFELEADDADGTPNTLRRLVFRRPPQVSIFEDYDLLRQVLVMNRLGPTPVTVPKVCWLDRSDYALGSPYYVMEQLSTVGGPGDVPSYHSAGMYFDASPQQRATMWWGCVQAIADVHALDWRKLNLDKLLMPDRGRHPVEQIVNYYCDMLQWATSGQPRAELAAAADWLRDNIYEPEYLSLCWGDSRLSNILYGPQLDVAAVVDWEIAYIGDHEADLAWLLVTDWAMSEYQGLPRLDGTPGREETVERYRQLTGLPVRNLLFNEMLAALALACPVSKLQARFRDEGLLTDDVDLVGFCVERIRQLLD